MNTYEKILDKKGGLMKPLEFKDLFIGMKVKCLDEDFGNGTIIAIKDIHNVEIHYGKNGEDSSGLCCFDPSCEGYYDPHYKQ